MFRIIFLSFLFFNFELPHGYLQNRNLTVDEVPENKDPNTIDLKYKETKSASGHENLENEVITNKETFTKTIKENVDGSKNEGKSNAKEKQTTEKKIENNKKVDEHEKTMGDEFNMGEELEALLHDGAHNVHAKGGKETEKKDEDQNGFLNMEEELETMLHGGERHVHSGKHRSFIPENSTSQYGTADQENLLHGEDHDVHAKNIHKEGVEATEQVIGSADPEMTLHGGKGHEEEDEKHQEDSHETLENLDPSTELEALLHGDDGHAHEKAAAEEVGDGKVFIATDPDHLLHGKEGAHGDKAEEEEEYDEDERKSRNLQFSPSNVDGNVGSITKEDFIDYQEWKKNRNVGKKNWMSGFSYISDSIKINFDAIKSRYLSIFPNSTDKRSNIHDEA